MTEVAFYQLRTTRLESALPKILEKALAGGHRALVLSDSEERVAALNAALWTYDPDSFLPHGSARDGNAERQPILLATPSAEEANANAADLLVTVGGVEPATLERFARCLDIFDGTDEEALAAARRRWQARKAEGHAVTYWAQTEGGRWQKEA